MSLVSLVYVSVASDNLTDEDIKDILQVARDFNAQHDITGMLLYRDFFFIQALEGEEEQVEALYEKIAQDPRHQNVLTVHKTPIEQRSFTQWSMGFNKIEDAEAANVPGFSDFLQNKSDMSYFTSQPSRATKLLEAFKDRIYF